MNPIQLLLRHSIDYAGLFPPAGLSMPAAVANYAEYSAGPDSWGLGRFILPVSRLTEFEEAAQKLPPTGPSNRWRLSALPGADLAGDLNRIAAFNSRNVGHRAGGVIDSIEIKSGSVAAIEDAMGIKPDDLQAYFELPIERDPAELVAAVGKTGGRAKVRTGGVTQDAFPSISHLARFIQACVGAEVPFKATAGLHHAFRAEYPLTYDAGSARSVMFGFLNLFLATALMRRGVAARDASRALEEASPETIQVDERGIAWSGNRLDLEALGQARETLISFGSCSFTEPIGELQALHLLGSRVQRA
jgi:hypothetical protein